MAELPGRLPGTIAGHHHVGDTFLKTCFKCGESKPESEFYAHRETADRLLGKCKTCTRKDVSTNRRTSGRSREYDRERSKTPARKALAAANSIAWAKRHPDRDRAQKKAQAAVRSGTLVRRPCRVCGDPNVHAHHADYAKPLDVDWLCPLHHSHVTHGV